MIKSVNIIGAGNVGTYFVRKLSGQVKIRSVFALHPDNARVLCANTTAEPVSDLSQLPDDVDLNIVCVKDDSLAGVASQLNVAVPVAHTSGSYGIEVFTGFQRFGILYPLQSISTERVGELVNFPFLVEGSSEEFTSELVLFAKTCLTGQVELADSDKRALIHLAAVFANNFTNYFLQQSESIMSAAKADFGLLRPLMEETIRKAFEHGPRNTQTGPAIRHDKQTMEKHLKMISDPEIKKVYLLISELIMKDGSSS